IVLVAPVTSGSRLKIPAQRLKDCRFLDGSAFRVNVPAPKAPAGPPARRKRRFGDSSNLSLGREFSTFWYEISSGTVRTEQATIDQAQARNAFRGHRLVRRSAHRLNPAPACERSAGGPIKRIVKMTDNSFASNGTHGGARPCQKNKPERASKPNCMPAN